MSATKQMEDMISTGAPGDRIFRAFEDLIETTQTHFGREELQMECHAYPGLAEHRREHAEVLEWLEHIRQRLERESSHLSTAAAGEIPAFFRAWVCNHLVHLDAPLERFVASHPHCGEESRSCPACDIYEDAAFLAPTTA